MKKLFVTLTAAAILLMSVVAVSAGEMTSEEYVRPRAFDADTFLEERLEILDQALEDGRITQEDYDLMVEHMKENAEAGVFGRGPRAYLNSEECILGEDGQLGLFRNNNVGRGWGRGNGRGPGFCR